MGSSVASSEELAMSDVCGGREDKILVSIRLRPLSDKEIERHDLSDWECMDENTLIFRNSLPERSMYPCAYTFDRVFGCDSSTRKVYEEGAKEVALSVVNGINASIFAYGQTSSGKTYTMTRITTYAVADIYDCIEQRSDREFVMKFSAIEIYNEAVRDLLSSDSAPLRLLDDPERGTVVERLTEETLRDRNHLAELLYICETQRKIGETSLNETSSRSHQILRLTIESSARDYFHTENSSSLAANVNFVDLAGSERASQTQSAGTRLKEGCHINRSLLTLGTVIRKLSKRRNGHVPYRDSKLTRILQHSLGGNARTAIICTINPSRSHIEQSRNTLLFAGCAKEVSTNAQVNVVMSDKALVKQLQKELTRLESHVKNLESTSASGRFAGLLREKELQIEKMEKEIKEVTQERDLAQTRVQELLRLIGVDKASRLDEYSESEESSDVIDPPYVDTGLRNVKASQNYHDQPSPRSSTDRYFQVPEMTNDRSLMDLSTPKLSGSDPSRGWELVHQRTDEKSLDVRKDVQYVERAKETRLDRVIETDAMLPSPDRKEADYVNEVPANESEMASSREEDKESDHLKKDYSCDTLDENQDTNEDNHVSAESFSPQREDRAASAESLHNTVKQENQDMDGDVTASPRKEDHVSAESFHDTVKQDNQDMYLDGETSPRKEDRDGGAISSPQKKDVELHNHASTCSFHDIVKRENQDMYVDGETSPLEKIRDGDAISFPQKEVLELNNMNIECACEALQQKVQNMQKTIKHLVTQNILEPTPCSKEDLSSYENIKLARSRSCTEVLVTHSHSPLLTESDSEAFAPPSSHGMEFLLKKPKKRSKARSCVRREKFWPQDSMKSVLSACLPSEHTNMSEEDIKAVDDMYRGLQEMAKSQSVSQFDDNAEVTDYEDANEDVEEEEDEFIEADKNLQPEDDWPQEFQRQRSKIIELWDACYVPLVHRTYFFLLFKGDPSDSIYMEVELRRLSFLKTSLNRTNPPKNSLTPTRASSIKALTREREMLSRQMHRKLDRSERESIYKKWGINLSTKQRSQQVTSRIWTDTKEMSHVEESAGLVARLVQLMEPGHQASKEMFGLSFSAGRALDRRSYSWRSLSNPFEV